MSFSFPRQFPIIIFLVTSMNLWTPISHPPDHCCWMSVTENSCSGDWWQNFTICCRLICTSHTSQNNHSSAIKNWVASKNGPKQGWREEVALFFSVKQPPSVPEWDWIEQNCTDCLPPVVFVKYNTHTHVQIKYNKPDVDTQETWTTETNLQSFKLKPSREGVKKHLSLSLITPSEMEV